MHDMIATLMAIGGIASLLASPLSFILLVIIGLGLTIGAIGVVFYYRTKKTSRKGSD